MTRNSIPQASTRIQNGHPHPFYETTTQKKLKMKTFPNHNGRQIPWPDDWAEPLAGANAGPLAGNVKFEAMKEDIKKRGLREKIQLTPDGKIASGRNRYRALRQLGWSHERIVAEASITVEATNLDAALSNIMRVNRTNFGLIASYLIAN